MDPPHCWQRPAAAFEDARQAPGPRTACDVRRQNASRGRLVSAHLVSYRRKLLSMRAGAWMTRLVVAALAVCVLGGSAGADDFYRGKTIRLVVASDVGGGYD